MQRCLENLVLLLAAASIFIRIICLFIPTAFSWFFFVFICHFNEKSYVVISLNVPTKTTHTESNYHKCSYWQCTSNPCWSNTRDIFPRIHFFFSPYKAALGFGRWTRVTARSADLVHTFGQSSYQSHDVERRNKAPLVLNERTVATPMHPPASSYFNQSSTWYRVHVWAVVAPLFYAPGQLGGTVKFGA